MTGDPGRPRPRPVTTKASAPWPAAGWYPDPGNYGQPRWWDGHAWAESIPVAVHNRNPRRRWRVPVLGGAIAALVCAGVVIYALTRGDVEHRDSGPPAGLPLAPVTFPIVYTLAGTADGADITYSVGGGTEQQQGVAVPLTNTTTNRAGIRFNASSGDFLYFSAQNTGDGSLICSIYEGGVLVDRHTSYGEFAIVTCQGTA